MVRWKGPEGEVSPRGQVRSSRWVSFGVTIREVISDLPEKHPDGRP